MPIGRDFLRHRGGLEHRRIDRLPVGVLARGSSSMQCVAPSKCRTAWSSATLDCPRSAGSNNITYAQAHLWLAAALAHLGRLNDARAAAEAAIALNPTFTIARFRADAPSDNSTFLTKRERIIEGMRTAGVPEGISLSASQAASSSSNAFASFRSRVSNPSVNQP
jgi:hypothetical protein